MTRPPLDRRRAGVLLHPTSLPGPGEQGRLGDNARAFVDFLATAGYSIWQTLPLSPRDRYGSPYASESAFAGDISLLDPQDLVRDGLLGADAAGTLEPDSTLLSGCLAQCADRLPDAGLQAAAADFAAREAYWLDDYTLYRALRDVHQRPWFEWPRPLRERAPEALALARDQLAPAIRLHALGQFLFARQWSALRDHARERGVLMFGDLPFFVAHDSADVWAHQECFRLSRDGAMSVETGVPPDYFSATGQLWHMPHYDWQSLRASGYRWWIQRLRRQSELFEMLRVDHFRGLAAAWEVPAGAADASGGHWVSGPGLDLLGQASRAVPELVLAAEDLGHITEDVHALRRQAGLPGMRVLQFGFDGHADNPHLPRNCDENQIYYTGTHDNDTLLGWYRSLDAHTAQLVRQCLDTGADDAQLVAAGRQRVLESAALLAMLPMQDLLALDGQARMNVPGRAAGNWNWRLAQLPDAGLAARERGRLRDAGRLVAGGAP